MAKLSGDIDISKYVQQLAELKELVKKAKSGEEDLDDVNAQLQKSFEAVRKEVKELQTVYASLNKEMGDFNEKQGIQNSLKSLQSDLEAISKSLKNLREDVTSTNQRLNELSTGGSGGGSGTSSAWGDLETQLKNINLSSEELQKNFLDVKTTMDSSSNSTTIYNNGLDTTVKVYKRLTDEGEQYRVTLEKINQGNKNAASSAKYIESSNEALKRLGLTTEEVADITNAMNNKGASSWNVARQSISANGDAVYELRNNLDKVVTVTQKNVDGTAQFSASLKNVTKNAKEASKEAGTWGYSWARAWQSFLTYMSVTDIFFRVKNAIVDMVHEVEELDSALVELKKVTDLEGESLNKFVDEAYEAGATVAKTGTEMVEAATQFAKAGYDESQILKLGTIASMYTNIADEEVSAAQAAEFLIAQMKAFNIEADNAEHIIDAVNEVSNNFAVSSADIANNLGKSSAVMANAGNSMEQMIGLMTAGTEVTRNASKVANGLKTITLRLQGMNDEGEEDLELQAQMEGMFQKLGISVYDANGELKNTYEIMETLASVYGDLTNAEKAYVTETIAGKFQAQNAAAILNNWKTAVEATETAMNSTGSAATENEKVLDSIEGHMQALASSWENFARSIIDSDLIKFFVDAGNAILKVANSDFGHFIGKTMAIIAVMALLRSAYTSITTKISQMTVGLTKNSAALVVNSLKLKAEDKELKKTIQKILTSKGAYDKETKSISKNALAEIENAMAKSGVSKAEQKKIMAQLTSGTVTDTLTAKTIALTIAQEAYNAALTFGVSALVSGAIALFKKLADTEEEVSKALAESEEEIEARENATSKGDELNEKNQQLDNYIAQYRKLHDELIDENTGYSRSIELRSEIIDLQGEINDLLGDENNGIDLINDSLDEVIEKQNQIKKQSAEEYMAANGAAVEKAKKNLKDNYYSGKRNQVAAYEWDFGGDNIGDERWENMVSALANSMNFSGTYSYGWGGKDKNHHGFDKEYYFDLSDIDAMTPQEALEMWKESYEDLQKNKQKYLDEYGLSDEDYQYILEVSNKNFKELKGYIDKQQQVIDAATESIIYSNEDYYKKINELQVAQAEYNKASASGDSEGIEKSLEKITNIQKYVDSLDDDNVKNYFNNILKQWQSDINKNKVKDELKKLDKDIQESLYANGINGDNFQQLFEQYQKGITTGLDNNSISLLNTLNKLFEDGQYDIADYTKWLEELGYIGKSVNSTFQETEKTIGNLGNEIDKITSKYDILTGAVDEFNDNGYISAKTFQSLVDNNLLDYLDWTKSGLEANTQALINEADALKINALSTLQESYAKDVLAIANDDLSAGTPYLTQALKDEKNAIDGLGDLAKAQTGGLFDLAKAQAAVQAAGGNLDVDKYGEKLNKLNNYYNNLAQSISNINIGSNTSGRYKGKDSSGSSSKEWWETELDNLKNQFNYSDITINEYINGLQNLLGRVEKGSEAWKKINQELQKQKLDKIKDDYNAGRISLNQYIISLQNLQKEYRESTKEWNSLADAIKKAKLDQLKEQQDDLKAALSAVNNELTLQINNYENLRDEAIDAIDEEIDKQKELKDSIDDNIDDYERAQKAVLKYLNEQLDSLNNNRDSIESYFDEITNSLENMNDEQERAVELAEAYENLVNAMSNKTKKVYKEGLGWVWEADQEAIKEAKKTYEDLLKESQLKEIEDNKDKTLEALDSQIEALENYITSWDEVLDKFENEKNKNLADLLLGENWTEAVSQLDPEIVEDFSNAYYNLQKSLEETEAEIERLNKQKEQETEYWNDIIDKAKEYKDEWSEIANAYEEAANKQKANQLLAANWEEEILNHRINVLEDFKNKYNRILSEIDKVNGMSTDSVSSYTPYALPGYSKGGEVNFTGLAMLHGTPNKPEYVFNNDQIKNLLSNLTKPQYVSNIGGGSSVINNYSFGNIELPNVQNGQQFINELKSLVNTSKNL